MGRNLAYARVSIDHQDLTMQTAALVQAAVEERDSFTDVISGTTCAC